MANQTLSISEVFPGGETGALNMEAIDGSLHQRWAKANAPLDADRDQFLRAIMGEPNIIAEGVCDNAATPVAIQLVDLTDKSVSFDASHVRTIRWLHTIQSDNDRFVVEYEQDVLGGTTPTLLGTRRVNRAFGVVAGTTVEYGYVSGQSTYGADTATAVAANSTAGSSVGSFTAGKAEFTHPIARSTPKRYWLGYGTDAAAENRALGIIADTSTNADIFGADLATPTADGFVDIGVVTAHGFILPPGDSALALNSTNVELQVTGIASDETRHRVEIWLGRQVRVDFQGS
jgi:hypothetical protein